MYDAGYTDDNAGRLQPPEEEERDCCGNCAYYRDAAHTQSASGMTHYIGVCIFDVFQANTFAELDKADVETDSPDDDPCVDYYRKEQ